MADGGSYRVSFVCSGNICRSPMAEAVMRELARRAGLTQVEIDSAGTGDWHIGERADLRALRALAEGGYPPLEHRARQFDTSWFTDRDLVVALDAGHARTLRAWAPDDVSRDRVRLLRSFDPALGAGVSGSQGDIADPYYDGDSAFTDVLRQIESACAGLIQQIETGQAPRRPVVLPTATDTTNIADLTVSADHAATGR